MSYYKIYSSGANVGNIGGSYLTGLINTNFGWKYNFYVNGVLALFVAFLWCFMAYDTPEQNPRMSENELMYISNNIIHNDDNSVVSKFPPCWAMVKSIKVWALVRFAVISLCLKRRFKEFFCLLDCGVVL